MTAVEWLDYIDGFLAGGAGIIVCIVMAALAFGR